MGIFLVTRMKKRIRYAVRERRPVHRGKGVTSDQEIVLTGARGKKQYPGALRHIGYRDPETGKHYVFLTNNFDLAAKTLADIYKARWQVELFFKWIKQNLDPVADEQRLINVARRKAGNCSVRGVGLEFVGGFQRRGRNADLGRNADFFSALQDMSFRFPYVELREPSSPCKLESEQPPYLSKLVILVIASEGFQPIDRERGLALP